MTPENMAKEWVRENGYADAQRFLMSWNNHFERNKMFRGQFPLDGIASSFGLGLPRNSKFHAMTPNGEDPVEWMTEFANEVEDLLSELTDSTEGANDYEQGRTVGLRFALGTNLDFTGSPMNVAVRPSPGSLQRALEWYYNAGHGSWDSESGIEFYSSFTDEANHDAMTDFLCGGYNLTRPWVEGFLMGWKAAESSYKAVYTP